MQALIDFVVRNLLQFWPVARVYAWQQGLRVRGGRIREELGPGLHWRVPFLDEVQTWPATEQAYDLETAAVTTADGVEIAISANLALQLTSIRQLYGTVWSAERTVCRLAIGEIASYCAAEPWARLSTRRAAVEAELLARLNARVRDWGLRVPRVHLTDLVKVRPHRHYVDGLAKP